MSVCHTSVPSRDYDLLSSCLFDLPPTPTAREMYKIPSNPINQGEKDEKIGSDKMGNDFLYIPICLNSIDSIDKEIEVIT
jgi:hypothetical protein